MPKTTSPRTRACRVLMHPSIWRATDPGRIFEPETYDLVDGWQEWGILRSGISILNDTEDFNIGLLRADIISVPWRQRIRFNGLGCRARSIHFEDFPFAVAICHQATDGTIRKMLGVIDRFADSLENLHGLPAREELDETAYPEFVLGRRVPWMPKLWEGDQA